MDQSSFFRTQRHADQRCDDDSREALLAAVVAQTPVCVKLVNAQGMLLDINDAGLVLLEAEDWEQVRGASVYDIVAENHVENFRRFNESVCNGNAERLQFEIVGLKGTRRWMDSTAVPFLLPNGVTVHLAITRDICFEKQREEQLRQAREVALESSRAKTEFLANMSHEIRTPMTAILGYADMLLGEQGLENAPEERVNAFQTIKRNGDHLLTVINDILDLSKIESGKLSVESIPVSPSAIVEEVITSMRVRAEEKNLELKVEWLGPLPATICSDPVRFRQVVINLVSNAIKFTDRGGVTIRVSLNAPNGSNHMLQVEVVDTGIGIAAEQIDQLFLAFSQADTSTTRQFGGTGLGLAITKRLVEMLGGEVSVQSVPGEGTTFTAKVETGCLEGVTMLQPDALSLLAKTNLKRPNASPVGHRDALLEGVRVLFAEDGPDNQRLISHILRKAGANVEVVNNGALAVEAVCRADEENHPYHVILMDMQMPIMDGYAATGELRRRNNDSPIIALTAHAMSTDRSRCINAGCDDYLSKPIDRMLLIETVAKYAASVVDEPDTCATSR